MCRAWCVIIPLAVVFHMCGVAFAQWQEVQTQGETVPAGRNYHVSVPTKDDCLLIHGGSYKMYELGLQCSVYSFCTSTNTWDALVPQDRCEHSSKSLARYRHSGIYYDAPDGVDHLVIFGGITMESVVDPPMPLNDVWYFNIAKEEWNPVLHPGDAPSKRSFHAAALDALQEEMIVFGGLGEEGFLNDMHSFHLGSRKWSTTIAQKGQVPSPRGHMAYATAKGKLFVFGGITCFGDISCYSNDLFEYTFDTNHWNQLLGQDDGNSPSPRSGCTLSFLASDRLVLFGGYDPQDGPLPHYRQDTCVYDVIGNEWVQCKDIPSSPIPRTAAKSVSLHGDVYLFGGFSERIVDGQLDAGYPTGVWQFSLPP